MGSDFVSASEAAAMLKRSRRAISDYMKNGLLRRVVRERKVFIPREDVEELMMALGSGFPPINRKNFNQLVAHVQKLEIDMTVLKRAFGIPDTPHRPTHDEAIGFYAAAEQFQAMQTWTEDEIRFWASQYEKMDDVFFDALAAHTGHGDAWRPFYRLCLRQADLVASMEGFETSLPLHHLHERLLAALKMMRKIILVWVEAGNSHAAEVARAAMDGQKEAVFRQIEQKRNGTGDKN